SEGLPVDLELDVHRRGVGSRTGLIEPIDMHHSGVLEDRHVVVNGFLGVVVEPEAGGNWLTQVVLRSSSVTHHRLLLPGSRPAPSEIDTSTGTIARIRSNASARLAPGS